MIVDCLENWELYFAKTAWKCAFDFIMSLKPDAEEKEYPLKGNDIFARVMSYTTRDRNEAVLEAHRKYVDIQTTLTAAEGIEWYPKESLSTKTSYDSGKDVEFFTIPNTRIAQIDVFPNTFVTLFPEDAHMPQLTVGDSPGLVKKVVVKINKELLI